MLEPSDSSDRVREIIAHFEDLTKAHDAVEARPRAARGARTRSSTTSRRYDDGARPARRARGPARRGPPVRRRDCAPRCSADELAGLRSTTSRSAPASATTPSTGSRASTRSVSGWSRERAGAGGDRIGELEREAAEARREADERRQRRGRYDAALAAALPEAVGTGRRTPPPSPRWPHELPARRDRARRRDRQRWTQTVGDVAGRARRAGAPGTETHAELLSLASRDQQPARAATPSCGPSSATTSGSTRASCPSPASSSTSPTSTRDGGARPSGCCAGSPSRCWSRTSTTTPSRAGSTVAGSPTAATTARSSGSKLVYERVAARRVPLQRRASSALLLADCLDRARRRVPRLPARRAHPPRRLPLRRRRSRSSGQRTRRSPARARSAPATATRRTTAPRSAIRAPGCWAGPTSARSPRSPTCSATQQAGTPGRPGRDCRRCTTDAAGARGAADGGGPAGRLPHVGRARRRPRRRPAPRPPRTSGSAWSPGPPRSPRSSGASTETCRAITDAAARRDDLSRDIGKLEDRRDRARRDLDADERLVAEQPGPRWARLERRTTGSAQLLGRPHRPPPRGLRAARDDADRAT